MTNRISAISYSPAVKNWLQNSRRVRVLHTFQAVVNLINSDNAILSIVSKEIGNGPFNLVLKTSDFPKNVTVDTIVIIRNQSLFLDGLQINLLDAQIWQPIPDWNKVRNFKESLLKSINIIDEILSTEAPKDSIAKIVSSNQINSNNIEGKIIKTAKKAITLLSHGLIESDSNSLQESARRLTGLGIGLTPAGDDFLSGVIYGFWAVYSTSKAKSLSRVIVQAAIHRTNELSSAWLRAAANGEASESWHQLLRAIIKQDIDMLRDAVRRILPTGHTSGADALGGFTFTVNLVLR